MIKWNSEWQLSKIEPIISSEGKEFIFKYNTSVSSLPADYLSFISTVDGAVISGATKKCCFIVRFAEGTEIWEIIELYGAESVINLTDASQTTVFYEGTHARTPPGYVWIGKSDDTHVLLCALEGHSDYGKIYGWMFSQDPWMEGTNTAGLGHIADSFTEFMNNLQEEGNL